jgi:Protein of unknown function (DUF3307)
MMTTTTVFLVLLSSHLVGDWVAQSDWQATNKTRSWAALGAHVGRYHLLMGLLLLAPILRDGWPAWKALVVLGVSAASHALIDRRWPVRALLRAVGSQGLATLEWGVIAVDQALHLSILAMLAVLLG